MMFEPIHVLVKGDPGAGKTTFAATFPTPGITFCFDAAGKDRPYRSLGDKIEELTEETTGELLGYDVYKDDAFVWRVLFFRDVDITKPRARPDFEEAYAEWYADHQKQFKTVVLDSFSAYELAARKYEEYYLQVGSKDKRLYWAGSTDNCEELLCRLAVLSKHNVILIAHIDQDKDQVMGNMVYNAAMPGRLRSRGAMFFSEIYHIAAAHDVETGVTSRRLQTAQDGKHHATTQIGAENGVEPYYLQLWANQASS